MATRKRSALFIVEAIKLKCATYKNIAMTELVSMLATVASLSLTEEAP